LLLLAWRTGTLAQAARRPVPGFVTLALAVQLAAPQAALAGCGGGPGPAIRFVFSEPLGTGVLVTGPFGAAVARRLFEPFGRIDATWGTGLNGAFCPPGVGDKLATRFGMS